MNQNVMNVITSIGMLACIGGMLCGQMQIKDVRTALESQANKSAEEMENLVKAAMMADPKAVFVAARRGGELAKTDAMLAQMRQDAAGAQMLKPGSGVLTRGAGMPVDAFTNFDCPYCRKAHAGLEKTDRIALSVRFVPNSEPADLAARAFMALAGKNKANAWSFFDELMGMEDAEVWKGAVPAGSGRDYPVLKGMAMKQGLSEAEWQGLAGNEEYTARLKADAQLGHKLGMRGTPFYVLNGKVRVAGAVPPALFADAMQIAAGGAAKADAGKDGKSGKDAKDAKKDKAGVESLIDGACPAGEDCKK